MAITRRALSGSTNGQVIAVATGAPTTLHQSTTLASTTSDECHVWFVNNGASATTISVYWGTTAVDPMLYPIPSRLGPQLVVPGMFLASGIAYASAGATGVGAYGIINRLTTGA